MIGLKKITFCVFIMIACFPMMHLVPICLVYTEDVYF